MQCPVCSEAELVTDARELQYTYKGESIVISSVAGEFCPACGEAILAATEAARISPMMLTLNMQVNATSDFIRVKLS